MSIMYSLAHESHSTVYWQNLARLPTQHPEAPNSRTNPRASVPWQQPLLMNLYTPLLIDDVSYTNGAFHISMDKPKSHREMVRLAAPKARQAGPSDYHSVRLRVVQFNRPISLPSEYPDSNSMAVSINNGHPKPAENDIK